MKPSRVQSCVLSLILSWISFAQCSPASATTLIFDNASSAGSATITNNTLDLTLFLDNATAANAAISNIGSSGAGGHTSFSDFSTAANSTITNSGSLASAGRLSFHDQATAAQATILNNGNSVTTFFNNSTAGNAHITNFGAASRGAVTFFLNASSAGSATIVNSGPGGVAQRGFLSFSGTATAANAAITNNDGGYTQFAGASTAGNAVITNNTGGFISSGFTEFIENATAGNSTIINNNRGRVTFSDSSSGGTAAFINNTGGTVNISGLSTPGTTAGSIAGGGSFILGSKSLTVGSNNLSTEVSGVISGDGGALVKTGVGVLTLLGANTYTGGTTINGGTLAIQSDSGLGAVTGGIMFNSGTLLTLSGILSTREITLCACGGTFNTNGFNSTLSGVITGPGRFIKDGDGVLTLSGVNTYTGNTQINAGTLNLPGSLRGNAVVAGGGHLTGTGTLQKLANSGTVSPGSNGVGALSVSNYAGPGTLVIEFNGAAHTSLEVIEDANLGGGTLRLAGNNFADGQYDVLTAGAVNGTFAAVEAPPDTAFVEFTTEYTPNAVEVQIETLSHLDLAQTPNQKGVAAVLDSIVARAAISGVAGAPASAAGSGGNLAPVLQALHALPKASQVDQAYGVISGDALTSYYDLAFRGAAVFSDQMLNHDSPQETLTTAALLAPAQALHQVFEDKAAGKNASRVPLWTRGVGLFNKTDGNSSIGSPATNTTTGGFAVGYDHFFTEKLLIGAAAGWTKTNLSVDERASSGESDATQGGLYTRYEPGPWFFKGSLAYTANANDNSRTIAFPGIQEQSEVSFHSHVMTGFAEAGYAIKPTDSARLEPFMSLRRSQLQQEGFTEAGSPGLNLMVEDQTLNSTVSSLGFRLSHLFGDITSRPFTLGARAAWDHEIGSVDNPVTARFADAPGESFTVHGTPRARDAAVLGLDGRLALGRNSQLFANYFASLSAESNLQGVLGGLRLKW